MKLKNKKRNDYEDDGLLPLVNIIFLLLIFFMIVGVIEKNIIKEDLQLPKVKLDKFENKDVTKIFYDENKNIFMNDERIDFNEINSKIESLKSKEIVLVADKSLLMSEINKILFILKKNQIKNIKLLSNRNAN
tara:strand:- start:2978 stop:3376 length:399 start_codon:yes stop_codon:yes gene_type:complete